MSSRSFRRRNNRRRHREGAEGGSRQSQGQQQPSPADGERQRRPQASDGRGRLRREGAQSGGQKRESPAADLPRRDPPTIVSPDCPVCGKPLRELPSALTHRASGRPAHFDCIMREIRDANELAPQEKLCYLGGGCFGILEFRQPGVTGKFVIRKRIPYEERETPQEWKKTLLVSC